jgi:TolA-binding protein
MRRTILLVALFAAVIVVGVSAQAFIVSYLDGTVELQTAKGWSAVSIGDKVPADATVRISDTGSLELTRARTKITLLKDGVFSVASLAAGASAGGSSGVGGSIAQKLQTLVTEKPKSSTAGGVRGAQQGSGDVTWVDENDETRAQVQALLDKKSWQDATKLLQDSIKNASSDADVAEFSYLLGVAYYGAGQTAKAYRTLAKVSADPGAAWYARYVILKAQVLVDTQNFTDALGVLTPFISDYPTGEATQVAYLLSGMSQKGLGNKAAAKSAFDTGFQLDASTDTAKLIDQQRKAL